MRKFGYQFCKRVFDVLVGLVGTIFLIPLTLIVKLAYLLSGDLHSIFFFQERIGKNGKRFKIVKYRSMIPGAEKKLDELMRQNKRIRAEYAVRKKIKKDPRITKVGKVLRRFSIDEMPQVLNVLVGSMSVVGNRPYLPREQKDMGKYYEQIIQTKPGITGLWQVSGHNDVPFRARLELEATYSDVASLGVDCSILLKTFSAVFSKGDGKK